MAPRDPALTHASDQLVAAFATLGACFGVFVREAQAAGATRAEASDGARVAVMTWITNAQRPADDAT